MNKEIENVTIDKPGLSREEQSKFVEETTRKIKELRKFIKDLPEETPAQKAQKAARLDRIPEIRDAVKKVAKRLDYPIEKITISKRKETFTLNGRQFDYAGAAYLEGNRKGEIEIYPLGISIGTSAKEIEGVVAHEIQHQRWQKVSEVWAAENKAVMQDPEIKEQKWEMPGGRKVDGMKPDGHLRPPLDKKYPIYELFVDFSVTDLKEEDGVTEYSRDWWKAFEKGEATSTQTVHETFAEIAHLEQKFGVGVDKLVAVKPQWRKWYKRVQKLYEAIEKNENRERDLDEKFMQKMKKELPEMFK